MKLFCCSTEKLIQTAYHLKIYSHIFLANFGFDWLIPWKIPHPTSHHWEQNHGCRHAWFWKFKWSVSIEGIFQIIRWTRTVSPHQRRSLILICLYQQRNCPPYFPCNVYLNASKHLAIFRQTYNAFPFSSHPHISHNPSRSTLKINRKMLC